MAWPPACNTALPDAHLGLDHRTQAVRELIDAGVLGPVLSALDVPILHACFAGGLPAGRYPTVSSRAPAGSIAQWHFGSTSPWFLPPCVALC